MSSHLWTITSHIVPASHIRGHPRGVQDEHNSHLRLSVNQYTPKIPPSTTGFTLLIAHGIGSPKELYEPLLDDLLTHANLPIRTAFSIDAAHHAHSYVLNQHTIGDEPHWLDPARDYLHVINTFQHHFSPPIYGLGQSWGCVNILMLSHIHPRLLAGLILMEPTFETGYRHQSHIKPNPLKDPETRTALLARRRDTWPSLSAAQNSLRKNPYFAPYDPRVFSRLIKYGLRPAPTPSNPDAVTLTTPKAQEVYTFGRPDPPFPGYDAAPGYATRKPETKLIEGFYRGEITQTKRALANLHPPVVYLWGLESDIGNSAYPARIIEQTGIGDLGGGGVSTGQVESVHIAGGDHLLPYKLPAKAAEAIAPWLRKQAAKWEEEVGRRKREQPPFNPGVLNPLWVERLSKL